MPGKERFIAQEIIETVSESNGLRVSASCRELETGNKLIDLLVDGRDLEEGIGFWTVFENGSGDRVLARYN